MSRAMSVFLVKSAEPVLTVRPRRKRAPLARTCVRMLARTRDPSARAMPP